jgi:CheY-like chemotaxis protein
LARPAGALGRLRFLVVEDEFLIACKIQSILADGGMAVAGPAASIVEALDLLRTGGIDAALLDARLEGEPVAGIVEMLRRQSIPVGLTTGYARDSLPAPLRMYPLLAKPYAPAELLSFARALVAERA